MPPLPFPEWLPDLTSYQVSGSQIISNVVPRADGYGPFGNLTSFTAPLAAGNDTYTKILLHFDGTDAATTITDSNTGGSAHTWTAAGNAQIDTAQSKFGGASGLFDGTGDWVTASDHADFTLGTLFTLDFWCRPAADGTVLYLCGQGDSTPSAATSSVIISRNASNFIVVEISNGSAFTTLTGATTAIVAGAWYHIELVLSGGTATLFVNGVVEQTGAFSGSVNNSAEDFRVGAGGERTTNPWNGWIEEFRLSVGVARHATAFTSPGSAYDVVTNGQCRGFFYAIKSDGSIAVFAATSTRIFQLNNTSLGWTDVSKGGLAYSAVPTSDHWQFAQFGSTVLAVQANTVPQAFDLAAGTAFANLGGSPPQAAYIAIVGRFVVLSGLLSTPFRIQWSGLNAITTWTSGTNSSDFQDLPDGGIVRGVAGGEYGVIFQDTVIRRMIYSPGSAVVFVIERVTQDKGLYAPYSLIRAADKIFFLAAQGLQVMGPTGDPVPIGKEKFDRAFFAAHDISALQYVIGAADPKETRIYLSYRSSGGSTAGFDTLLCFDYALNRATLITVSGEYIATLSQPGFTLEGLDTISTSIETLTFSFDEVAIAASAKLSGFSTSHALGFFTGANLEATLDTSEQAMEGRRVRVQGMRPNTDAATCYCAVGARETLQEAVTYSTEQAVNGRGFCPANVSTRLARGRLRIPAGTAWTFASSVEPQFAQEGKR